MNVVFPVGTIRVYDQGVTRNLPDIETTTSHQRSHVLAGDLPGIWSLLPDGITGKWKGLNMIFRVQYEGDGLYGACFRES
jgi:hypothetical protein